MSDKASALAPTRARHKVSNQSKNTKWTHEEDENLIQLVGSSTAPAWSDYAPFFPNKTTQQIAERWEKVLDPHLIKGSWTREEDEMIINFVAQNGTKNWTKLASQLPGRIGKQCRERWRNHLDPDVNRQPWTPEEDQILIDMHEQYGNQWVKIAEMLQGRSDNSVKNRWNSTLKKRLEYQKTGLPRPKRGRPSHKNVPKSADDVPKPPKFEEIVNEIKETSQTPQTPQGINSFILSPFTCLKSPFGPMSPMMKEMAGFTGFSPPRDSKEFESLGYSPNLFSPSLQENRAEMLNLLSPIFKK
ncbi:hypothetical protein M9Y10_001859 [Tritrichomonas musculus]|uniref:Myb-like DNA-binding domain containing protein n=1 Tax=Tritrichomonas musculus TaxID=1915356 RepID=A0ABR2L873_9EUKA